MVVFQEFPDEVSTKLYCGVSVLMPRNCDYYVCFCGSSQTSITFPFTEQSDEVSIMRYLLNEALPLTVPYSPETLSTISFHPVKVRCTACMLLYVRMYHVPCVPSGLGVSNLDLRKGHFSA